MKKGLDRILNLTRRLWCQLAISYTVLAFCAMITVVFLLYGFNDYRDFHTALSLEAIERAVASEQLTLAAALREGGQEPWLRQARDDIRKNLVELEHSVGTSVYRITNSSRPQVYLQFEDSEGRLLMSEPAAIPAQIADRFAVQKAAPPTRLRAMRLANGHSYWVDMPITDAHNQRIGRASVLFVAKFQVWVQLGSILDFLLHSWHLVLYCCFPIGLVCGLVAARYVTRQLHAMNQVTERWRQGDFSARISLPSDDVLLRHSQYLNEMAHDMEHYLSLKQHLAVRDERNRVARELHDTVKQKLFALGLQLATAKAKSPPQEAARSHLVEAEAINREAQHDLMEIITQLHPAETPVELASRIALLADDFMRRFDVRIEVALDASLRCAAPTEHHLLRLIQEAWMNAIRHGKAARISIGSTVQRERVVLTIADDGQGFDPTLKTDGIGLISMRERVGKLPDGRFELESAPGTGTRIAISWRNER